MEKLYDSLPQFKLGPFEFNAFSLLVVIGILSGSYVAICRAQEYALNVKLVLISFWWVLIGGFVGSHIVLIVIYHPELTLSAPWSLLKIWLGMSSIGGFFGAVIGLALFARRYRQPFAYYADVMTFGFLTGWIFGRMGCYVAHDHPGYRSEFFLSVAYPGGSRHDLGFYELLLTLVLFGVFEWIRRQELAAGCIAILLGLMYTPIRFCFDFLRTNDVRYFTFTPAQFGCVLIFVSCLVLFHRLPKKRRVQDV